MTAMTSTATTVCMSGRMTAICMPILTRPPTMTRTMVPALPHIRPASPGVWRMRNSRKLSMAVIMTIFLPLRKTEPFGAEDVMNTASWVTTIRAATAMGMNTLQAIRPSTLPRQAAGRIRMCIHTHKHGPLHSVRTEGYTFPVISR